MKKRSTRRRGRDDRVCPVCKKSIESGAPVFFEHGDLLHLSRYETLTTAKKPPKPVTPPFRDETRPDESREA